jgi:hypothetical protein
MSFAKGYLLIKVKPEKVTCCWKSKSDEEGKKERRNGKQTNATLNAQNDERVLKFLTFLETFRF